MHNKQKIDTTDKYIGSSEKMTAKHLLQDCADYEKQMRHVWPLPMTKVIKDKSVWQCQQPEAYWYILQRCPT